MGKYQLDSRFVQELDDSIEAFVARGVDAHDEAEFNRLALLEFEYQYHANEFYRDHCNSLGRSPDNVNDWRQVPPVPSRAFKDNLVVSFPTDKAELFFMTSGTTDPTAKGQIYRDKRGADLHYKANILATQSYLFPDVERMRVLLMVPSPEIAPHMGMAIGLHIMKDEFGTEDSAYLITKQGLNVPLLISALREAEQTGRPIALVGATSGFVVLYNQFGAMGLRFKLPAGSRIADGGGYSGIFGDCSQNDLLRLTREYLDIPPEYVINTLGTAESATNYLDHTIRTAWLGLPQKERCKAILPWTRVVAMDTKTFEPLPHGEVGLLCLYDLVNRSTAMAVQTDNLGYTTEDGFEIIGRTGGLTQEGRPAQVNPTVVTDLLKSGQPAGMPAGHPANIPMGHPPHGMPPGHPPIHGMPAGHPPIGHPAGIPMGHPANIPMGRPPHGMPPGHPPIGHPAGIPMGHPANIPMGHPPMHGKPAAHPEQVCSTVADNMLKEGHPEQVCSTVADNMLKEGHPEQVCSTVADNMLKEGHPEQVCSTVADRMLKAGEVCSTVADEMLKTGQAGQVCSTVADILLKGGKKQQEAK